MRKAAEFSLTRREIVALSSAAPALLITKSKSLFAQTTSSETIKQMDNTFQQGLKLRSDVIEAELPLSSSELTDFVVRDFQLRRNFVSYLAENKISEDENFFLLKDLPQYANQDRGQFYNFVVGQNINPIPNTSDILPSAPTTIPPIDIEDKDASTDIEPAWVVVIDILLETLDISINQELFAEILRQNTDLQKSLEEIVKSISTKNWEDTANNIDKILTIMLGLLTAGKLLKFLSEKSAERIARQFAFSMTVRLTPFFGWLYTVTSLLVAIKANYHRF